MSQNSYVIANNSGSGVRANLNLALDSLATNFSGTSRPSGIQAGQTWIDTDTPSSTVWSVYFYDGASDVKVGEIDSTNHVFTPYGNGASLLAGGTTNTSSTSLATMANVQASMLGGFVNKFRNPAMDVWQRGTSGTITAGSPSYTADGWIVGCTGANVTWAQTAGRYATLYALKVTGNTSVTDALVKQRIESYLCAAMYPGAAARVTVQAKVYNNTGGAITPTLTVKHAGSADNWSSPTTDVNAVSLQSCPDTTLTTIAYTFSSASGTANGLEVTFDFGNNFSTSGKSIEISELDIRVTPGVSTGTNSSPPVPELRHITSELQLCQRYYWKSFNQGVAPAQNAGTNTGELALCAFRAGANPEFPQCVTFPVTMRSTSPTITFYNPSAANAQVRDVTITADCSSTTTGKVSDNNFSVTCTGNASTAVGDLLIVHATASAEL